MKNYLFKCGNVFVVLLLFSIFDTVYAEQNFFENEAYIYSAYYDDLLNPGFEFSFYNGFFSMDIPALDQTAIEEGNYIKEKIHVKYSVEKNGDFVYLQLPDRRYLVLCSDSELCILVDKQSGTSFIGVNKKSKYVVLNTRIRNRTNNIRLPSFADRKYSSALQEGSIIYNGKGRYFYDIFPWVEADKEYGIKEWREDTVFFRTKTVVIINGFVDAFRPDSFQKNGRVKRIKITNNNNDYYFDIKDTPNPQIIYLPSVITGKILYTIEDVYKGTVYKDTAVSAVFYLSEIRAPN